MVKTVEELGPELDKLVRFRFRDQQNASLVLMREGSSVLLGKPASAPLSPEALDLVQRYKHFKSAKQALKERGRVDNVAIGKLRAWASEHLPFVTALYVFENFLMVDYVACEAKYAHEDTGERIIIPPLRVFLSGEGWCGAMPIVEGIGRPDRFGHPHQQGIAISDQMMVRGSSCMGMFRIPPWTRSFTDTITAIMSVNDWRRVWGGDARAMMNDRVTYTQAVARSSYEIWCAEPEAFSPIQAVSGRVYESLGELIANEPRGFSTAFLESLTQRDTERCTDCELNPCLCCDECESLPWDCTCTARCEYDYNALDEEGICQRCGRAQCAVARCTRQQCMRGGPHCSRHCVEESGHRSCPYCGDHASNYLCDLCTRQLYWLLFDELRKAASAARSAPAYSLIRISRMVRNMVGGVRPFGSPHEDGLRPSACQRGDGFTRCEICQLVVRVQAEGGRRTNPNVDFTITSAGTSMTESTYATAAGGSTTS